ncbi:MAG: phosphonate ABC transporter substrate-binding protein [Rhodospirillaceae bacterium]|nr:phosphonate ABC transporter substrate-binding protein [Rhodospirillaceae bacterium]
MKSKLLTALTVGAVILAGAAAKAEMKELNFGIISTESSQNLKTIWEPFLADMAKKTGYQVKSFFASDYAGIIEAMRFNKVQVAWFGNRSAIEAVDRASGEVFVQTVDRDGNPGYWSLVIVHKDGALKTLDDLLKCGKNCTFGNGDPNSTSGFAVPGYYVFARNGIDPKTHFKRMTTANHESNALAVANKRVDAATNNTENMDRLLKTNPKAHAQIRVLWKSPLIPSDPIVWRKDIAGADKKKIRDFFLTYGTKDPAERKVLAGLQWAPFRESSNKQLIPVRQIVLARELTKVEGDKTISAEEKKKKIGEIKAKLEVLNKELSN